MARSAERPSENLGTIRCLVTQADAECFSFQLNENAKGQDLMDKICERLGIVERDYFGFQYSSARGEILWLNMRNRITRQLPKPEPFSLQFCVKFFVQPHQILQESTRRQFFLDVKKDVKNGKYRLAQEQLTRIQALLMQALAGDFRENHIGYPLNTTNWTDELRNLVILEHCKLKGMPQGKAEYLFLSEIAKSEEYGMEYQSVRTDDGGQHEIGIGIDSLKLCHTSEGTVERVPYSCLRMATHSGKSVKLDIYTSDLGDVESVQYRLNSKEAACALYRSITEHHAFYRCDSVRPAVKTQVSKDLIDTVLSWFSDENAAERNYIFDTERTSREAYDYARRILYNFGCRAAVSLECGEKLELAKQKDASNAAETALADEVADLREKLNNVKESIVCRICYDSTIDTVFQCGHAVCCQRCAEQCISCPICRAAIEQVNRLFLPVNVDLEGHL